MDKESFEAAVLNELQAVAARRHKSLRAIAEEIGCDYGTYWRYVKGKRAMPLHILFATLDALDISPDKFMQEAERHMGL